jgi:hypothetical protein
MATLTHLTIDELLRYRHDPVTPELLEAMWIMLERVYNEQLESAHD